LREKGHRHLQRLAWLSVLPAVLIFSACPGGKSQGVKDTKAAEPKAEITVRNVTNRTVDYSIKKIYDSAGLEEHSLEPGDLDCFPTDERLEIYFEREGETTSYTLDVGLPYSFRYDENVELDLFEGSHGRTDAVDLAPYVPTPMPVVEKMLELAKVNADSLIYDLGCGDGRIVITAAKNFGARGVGIDLDPQRIKECHAGAKAAQVEDRVEFRNSDVMKADFSEATIVALYLLPESNELLRPLFDEQLKDGALVVSHNYPIPGWEEKEIDYAEVDDEEGEEHLVYLYKK
jgi:SAM-dependent methyltransferase